MTERPGAGHGPPGREERPEDAEAGTAGARADARDGGDAALRWRRVDTRLVLDRSPWLRVFEDDVELPGGGRIDGFLRVESPEHVQVFAVTEDGHAVFIREYKYGPDRPAFKLPAGYLEANEEPVVSARRELLEETGYEASNWTALGRFTVDGNRGFGAAHYFLARGARRTREPQPDDFEVMTTVLVPLRDVPALLASDAMAEMGPVAGVGLALARLAEIGTT